MGSFESYSYLVGFTASNLLSTSLQWRNNDHDGVSNHQPHGCLLDRLFRRRSKKTPKLRVTGLCAGNYPGPANSLHKWPVTRKMFPFDDVIMIWNMSAVFCAENKILILLKYGENNKLCKYCLVTPDHPTGGYRETSDSIIDCKHDRSDAQTVWRFEFTIDMVQSCQLTVDLHIWKVGHLLAAKKSTHYTNIFLSIHKIPKTCLRTSNIHIRVLFHWYNMTYLIYSKACID